MAMMWTSVYTDACVCVSVCEDMQLINNPAESSRPAHILFLYLGLRGDARAQLLVGQGGAPRRRLVPKTEISLQVSDLAEQTRNGEKFICFPARACQAMPAHRCC